MSNDLVSGALQMHHRGGASDQMGGASDQTGGASDQRDGAC